MLFDFKTKHISASTFKIEDALSCSSQIPFGYPNVNNTEKFLNAYKITYRAYKSTSSHIILQILCKNYSRSNYQIHFLN